ncbi:MAG: TolB family protein, partial [Bryobacteraceae bacterium]
MTKPELTRFTFRCFVVYAGAIALFAQAGPSPIGLFSGNDDVGTVLHKGSAQFDSSSKTYTLTGSGENLWAAEDDFHFVWKKVSTSDVTLAAGISILGMLGDNHRKALLMIRQSLDPDSPYVDIAVHGDGLTSLQFRDEKGGLTHEIESSQYAPKRLQIEKRHDRFYIWIGRDEHDLQFAGGSTTLALSAPYYVGIGVCAHDKNAIQQAAFSNVDLNTTDRSANDLPASYSTLETINVQSTDARVSYVTQTQIEAPVWSQDGASLIFYLAGKPQRVPVSLYVSGHPASAAASVTPEAVPPEMAPPLTASNASDDRYSRVSPDGSQIVFLTYPNDADNGNAVLSVMSVADKKTRVLAKLKGGQGTLGAHPWSPDGKRVAFVSYQSFD